MNDQFIYQLLQESEYEIQQSATKFFAYHVTVSFTSRHPQAFKWTSDSSLTSDKIRASFELLSNRPVTPQDLYELFDAYSEEEYFLTYTTSSIEEIQSRRQNEPF